MKRFKEFLKKKVVDPILITAQPVHGNHASAYLKEQQGDNTWLTDWTHNSHIADTHDEVHDKLEQSQPNITKHKHWKAATHYTGVGSYRVNKRLIDRSQDPEYDVKNKDDNYQKFLKSHTTRLDAFLSDHSLDHDVHVFHGTNQWHPGNEAAKHPERLVKIPSFLSTSISKQQAREFTQNGLMNRKIGRHILHIHVKKGQRGVYLGTRSKQAHEQEMLLPRNQTLKINPKPTILKDKTHVWHATIHHQE